MKRAFPSMRASSGTLQADQQCLARELDFERLVELYRPRVFRYALAFLRDRDAADTVTQDCFLRAYHALTNFREECSLQTWLMRIAVNLVRDYVKNRRLQFWKRTSSGPARALEGFAARGSGGQSPEKAAILKQEVDAIWQRASLLPNRQKTVFLLRFGQDMDILEIAAVTEMREGTVKTHLFRAIRTLRGALLNRI